MNYREMIFVVDPAQHTPELDTFNLIACTSKLPCSHHLPGLFGMTSIDAVPVKYIKGIIVLGSKASVYDGLPWQTPLNTWLMKMMEIGTPTFGICYGHQLIAHLYGAEVGFLFPSQEKVTGFRTVDIAADGRLGRAKSRSPLIVTHREIVTRVPDEMELWATSELSVNDGFRHKKLPIWTMQPHPEGTPLFLAEREISQPLNASDFSAGHEILRGFLNFATQSKS
jgi:GMP synthase (glutamine-hydrolysing)